VDGTSFAAPIVSSVVAQMLEERPELKPHEVKQILIKTAVRIPHVAVDRQGWGMVNPRLAVRCVTLDS
jgi:serine protease AprX